MGLPVSDQMKRAEGGRLRIEEEEAAASEEKASDSQ
jgi:hypothetical protein